MNGSAFVLSATAALFVTMSAWAAGGSSQPKSAEQPRDPGKAAVDDYNAGLKHRDKAWFYEAEAVVEAGKTDKQKEKYRKRALKEYGKAAKRFESATGKDPQFHQAFSSLGYALRKMGDYDSSIEAYDRALALSPKYTEALEYRGEAYLGLDRVDDAKKAYMILFDLDRARAGELLTAMNRWVEDRREHPGDFAADVVEQFSTWIRNRRELEDQAPDLSQMQSRDW